GTANNYFHLLPAQSARCPATVHSGITSAEDNHLPANFIFMTEGYTGQKIDANMNVGIGFLPTGKVQISSFGRTGTNKYCIVFRLQYSPHAVHIMVLMRMDSHVSDVILFLIEYAFRQT